MGCWISEIKLFETKTDHWVHEGNGNDQFKSKDIWTLPRCDSFRACSTFVFSFLCWVESRNLAHTRVFSSSSAHMYDEGHTDNVKIWLVRFISSNKNDVNFRLGRHLRTVDCSPLQIVTDIFLVNFLLNLFKLNKYSLSYIYILYIMD